MQELQQEKEAVKDQLVNASGDEVIGLQYTVKTLDRIINLEKRLRSDVVIRKLKEAGEE